MTILSGTSSRSAEELRSVIDDLLHLHQATPSITVGRGKIQRLMLLHGLVEHSLVTVRAGLILWDAGDRAGFPVLARVAFEHALVAQWVHTDPDGLEGFMTLTDNKQRKFLKTLPEMAERADELQAALDAYGDHMASPPEMHSFEQTCQAFDPSGWMYLMYRVLSDYVHPGQGTFDRYVTHSDDPAEPATLRIRPFDPNPDAALTTLTLATVLASGVYEDIRRTKPNKAAVKRIAARVGMTPLLELAAE